MTKVKQLTEAEAFQLMFATVGGGWINLNILANLTRKQLKTAHIDDEYDPRGFRIDVWLNSGEFATLASGFRDEKVAEIVLYYIRPKTKPSDYKHLKQDGLNVFEFRPDLT